MLNHTLCDTIFRALEDVVLEVEKLRTDVQRSNGRLDSVVASATHGEGTVKRLSVLESTSSSLYAEMQRLRADVSRDAIHGIVSNKFESVSATILKEMRAQAAAQQSLHEKNQLQLRQLQSEVAELSRCSLPSRLTAVEAEQNKSKEREMLVVSTLEATKHDVDKAAERNRTELNKTNENLHALQRDFDSANRMHADDTRSVINSIESKLEAKVAYLESVSVELSGQVSHLQHSSPAIAKQQTMIEDMLVERLASVQSDLQRHDDQLVMMGRRSSETEHDVATKIEKLVVGETELQRKLVAFEQKISQTEVLLHSEAASSKTELASVREAIASNEPALTALQSSALRLEGEFEQLKTHAANMANIEQQLTRRLQPVRNEIQMVAEEMRTREQFSLNEFDRISNATKAHPRPTRLILQEGPLFFYLRLLRGCRRLFGPGACGKRRLAAVGAAHCTRARAW